jgi:DSF synthase
MVKIASVAQHAPQDDTALTTRLDSSLDTLWVSLQPVPGRPLNFSPQLLSGVEQLLGRIEENDWHWREDSGEGRLRYLVFTSSHPRHFALGGDLAYFQSCIESGNAGALRAYSMRCLELIRRIYAAAHEVTTVTLVQGRALGGGFEVALSASHLIAERGAQFGFPEIAFGTFPCSGGMTLLANRIGLRRAAAFMRNARIHTAADLHAQGVIDDLCEPGEGPAAVQRFIAEHRRRYNARMALQRAEARMGVFDLVEMRTVVEDWVATAMALSAEERRVLDTLVRMQAADAGAAAVTPPTALKRSA